MTYLITLFMCVTLSGKFSFAEVTNSKDSEKIQEKIFSGESFFIPHFYLISPSKNMPGDTISIQILYPDFLPAKSNKSILVDPKHSSKKIDVFAKYQKDAKPSEQILNKTIRRLGTFKIAGNEFGLIHRTQPDGYNQKANDTWIERSKDSEYRSHINCSEPLSHTSVSQCYHHYIDDNFRIKVSYDRHLLPQWRTIQDGVLELFDSFQTRDSALEFMKKKLARAAKIR